jgi:hypothetical protein
VLEGGLNATLHAEGVIDILDFGEHRTVPHRTAPHRIHCTAPRRAAPRRIHCTTSHHTTTRNPEFYPWGNAYFAQEDCYGYPNYDRNHGYPCWQEKCGVANAPAECFGESTACARALCCVGVRI